MQRLLFGGATAACAGLGLYLAWEPSAKGLSSNSALRRDQVTHLPLLSVERETHDTSRFRFGFPRDKTLELETPCHLVAYDNAMVSRAYTPVHVDSKEGYFELLVKRYRDGYMSSHIHNMQLDTTLGFALPNPRFSYATNMAKRVVLIAGGTGITPMWQVINTVLNDPADVTKISLLYANKTENDILLKEQLENLVERHPNRLDITYVVEAPSESWSGAVGRLSPELLAKTLPKPEKGVLLMVCGPDAFMQFLCGRKDNQYPPPPFGGWLGAFGYSPSKVWCL